MIRVPKKLKESLLEAQEMLNNTNNVTVYSKSDCDGIASAAIISLLLDHLNIKHNVQFITFHNANRINTENNLTIVTSILSDVEINFNIDENHKLIIIDHQKPLRSPQDSDGYKFLEINTAFYGLDGNYHISASGLSYLLANEYGLTDLAWIAIVGAIGDMQDGPTGKLSHLNEMILKKAVANGDINLIHDITLYGRQTKPLYASLAYFRDFKLPITNDTEKAIEFLNKLKIPYQYEDHYRSSCDLSKEERHKLYVSLSKMLSKEVSHKYIKYVPKILKLDSYELVKEPKHTIIRDIFELSNAMKYCATSNKADIGFKILKGERNEVLNTLNDIVKEKRIFLIKLIREISSKNMIQKLDYIQYFTVNSVPDELLGTLASRVIAYGDWEKPIVGFRQVDDKLRVSMRCSRLLGQKGIHLGRTMNKIADSVGGTGGGHFLAAGGYIPLESKEKFLMKLNTYFKVHI